MTYARLRDEVGSQGFDDLVQLVGGDAANSPNWSGIRIPGAPGFRYRILTAVLDTDDGDEIVGLAQHIELLALVANDAGGPPFYPFTIAVTNPTWRFIDGATTWTLTAESVPPSTHSYNANESESASRRDSNVPAFLFETIGFPAVPTEPGYLGLNAYTAPGMLGEVLITSRDLRWPWFSNGGIDMRYRSTGATRWRFYCDVLQTNPAQRFNPTLGGAITGAALAPEDRWLLTNFATTGRYGRVAGRILKAKKGS